ncbi:MAG: putative FmdB family regulatory protein [Desulforhopalus sp.]|jgi:putative FmdB family regulatory protein
MPVYEYECKACEKVFEIQQKMADDPLTECPECEGPITKLMSMSSFQLKGGGWYADGYSSKNSSPTKPASSTSSSPAKPAACKADSGCAGCPAAPAASTT